MSNQEAKENKVLLQQMQEQFADPAKPLPEPKPEKVTVETLDQLCKDIFTMQEEIDKANTIVKQMNKNLDQLRFKAVGYLKDLKREDYKSPFGSIRVAQKWRVNMPATEEEKLKFFEYLREKGLFEKYATVHSQSLNAYYMAEWNEAKKRGEGIGFGIPGIGEPKLFEDLGIRRSGNKSEPEGE